MRRADPAADGDTGDLRGDLGARAPREVASAAAVTLERRAVPLLGALAPCVRGVLRVASFSLARCVRDLCMLSRVALVAWAVAWR